MRQVVVVCAKRSPIGNFGCVFKDISAINLGVTVLQSMLKETGLKPELIDEVIIGNVCGAGLGQNVARQIAIHSGIPETVPAYTVNKVCGSGMKAVSLASLMIGSGEADIIVAGGTENMSQIPYALTDARWGARMGDKEMVDLMIRDGLSDIFNDYHMGITAENLAEKYNISREEQDAFSAQSQNRTEEAQITGKFKDEMPRAGVTVASIAKLRPAFKNDGTVTAANSSGINDSAAFLILMSAEKAKELGLKPMATFVNSASAGVNPSLMGYGPVPAIKKVLLKAGWNLQDIELAELNEAFAAQSLAVLKGLELEGMGKLNPEIVNVNGGAIALGHPIGASGTRIIVTLLHEMKRRETKKGLAALCIGGGMGIATLWEMEKEKL